jgi:hypothetical protein
MYRELEAIALAEFMNGALIYYPYKRWTAQDCLRNRWIYMPININVKYTE